MKRTWVIILAACSLAACQSLYQDNRPRHPQPPPPVARAEPVEPPAPLVPVQTPPKPKPRPATTPPAPAVPAEPIVIVGLSRAELARTLGEPAERTEHNPGQSWVYRAPGCSVEVLFLFDVVRNEMFAIDRKLSGTDGSPRAEQQCLQRIKAGHAS